MKDYRKAAVVLGLLFTLFVVVEYYRPKPIDWSMTFSNKDKIPYGTYVLYQLLPDLFQDQEVKSVRQPIQNQVESLLAHKEGGRNSVNYLFVHASFQADSLELAALLDFVRAGNQAFISAYAFEPALEDTLHLEIEATTAEEQDSMGLVFTHPSLKGKKTYTYDWEKAHLEIMPDSAAQLVVLGRNTAGGANFVQVPYGKGYFYLSSVPVAFSNYYVIKSKQNQYASLALSHLPEQPVWWDEYQKQGATGDNSEFRVLLQHEPLTWAYYITLGGLFLFLVFESKRTQRLIPVVEKPKNTTLEFVQVVGNLYFNYKDHKNIAEKKITYFLEYLRLHYHESTSVLDDEFKGRISQKTGVELTEINKLFNIIHDVRHYDTVQEITLWQLNKKLENFYRQVNRR
ncbi:MAG: DUF4350 domain-containing protein [Rufibacter sp.]